jgi:hypothetical protein
LHDLSHGGFGSGLDGMDVAGNQLGGGWATYLGGEQDGAIREQVGARDDPVFLAFEIKDAAVAQTVRGLLAHFPDKEGFAAAEVAIDANSVAAGEGYLHGELPFSASFRRSGPHRSRP